MSKLFTLTIIPKIVVEDDKIVSVKKQGNQNKFLKIEVSFNDIDIESLIKAYLLSNVANPKQKLEIVFENIYFEKDGLVGHIYVLYKVFGYNLQEIDNTKFEFIDEQEFKYGKK